MLKEKEKEQEAVTLQAPPRHTPPRRRPTPPDAHETNFGNSMYPSSHSSSSSTGTPPNGLAMPYGPQPADILASSFEPSYHPSTSMTPDYSAYSPENELLWSSWPEELPPPNVLNHLVEVFFSSVPLATRILHKPTFFASLMHPPRSPQFPSQALLHSICALASLYTAVTTEVPSQLTASEWAARPWWKGAVKSSSFGHFHAKAAKRKQEEAEESGKRLFESVQCTFRCPTPIYCVINLGFPIAAVILA